MASIDQKVEATQHLVERQNERSLATILRGAKVFESRGLIAKTVR